MYTQLKEKLWSYIVVNNPDFMFRLQDEYNVVKYLDEKISSISPFALSLLEQGKPGHVIQELCMNQLTAELKPSRYNYIGTVLSEEFEEKYSELRDSGLFTYEAVNLVEFCKSTFDDLHFSEKNEDDKTIYYAITCMIADYFDQQQAKQDQ